MEIIAPKISILIPTYNYGRYLCEAIDSVLAQDFHNYELIISDDCSSDNTEEIISRYKNDTRIRYYRHKKNLGMVENWNWCLSEARGEFIKFVFGDDKLSRPDALTKLIKLMENNQSATLGACARTIIDKSSSPVKTLNDLGSSGRYDGSEIIYKCLDENRNIIGEPTVTIFRKKNAGLGFSMRYQQLVDLEFWFRLLEKGDLVYEKEPLCCFRNHDSQQTVKNRVNGIAELENLMIFHDYSEKIIKIKRNIKWRQFKKLHTIQKLRKKIGKISLEMEAFEKIFSRNISRSRYFIYLLFYKSVNPVFKIWRYLKKTSAFVTVKAGSYII